MSEMVERVARAMIKEMEAFDASTDHSTLDSRHLARVMIEAMREPTEAMVNAGRAETCEHGDMQCGAAESWVAMIDEALKD